MYIPIAWSTKLKVCINLYSNDSNKYIFERDGRFIAIKKWIIIAIKNAITANY